MGYAVFCWTRYCFKACILVRNTIQAFPLLKLCSRDAVAVRLTFNGGGSIRDHIITSAYLPYDSDEPSPSGELWDVVNYCCRNNLQLIAGCDANAHHIVWGSTGISPRGSSLLEYLVSANLNILISGFRRDVDVICGLLGNYTVSCNYPEDHRLQP